MKALKYILLSFLGILVIFILWGLIEPYFIDKQEEVATIPNLPEAWEGQKVGVVGDFQVGMWLDNTNTVRRSIQELVEEKPAFALIIGDFVYHTLPDPETEIGTVTELLRPLVDAGIPTYAVLGNHDYSMSSPDGEAQERVAQQLEGELEAMGVSVLENEAARVFLPGENTEPLYLVGIAADWPGRDRPQVAFADVPDAAPRFVMMHNPNSFAEFAAQTAPIAVAGHTHGGQIRLPLTPQSSWLSFVKQDKVHADGWIDKGYGTEGNRLYVNRGIGFSLLPMRINCPPEITMFTLRPNDTVGS
ncbi:metallophosphoesterase [Phormidium sp. CCY1219]|uniref:metallophosphoesterase n=1 Tax=Phormidium sp. CCY1219 TaxID=2886104 RepID=UPI002D1EAB32|nr:metallophosphoesterase [Phormidium sp. CCY1219]MEB3826689.1 metallophosphoesterase [Phormidium sp. CCY1219]